MLMLMVVMTSVNRKILDHSDFSLDNVDFEVVLGTHHHEGLDKVEVEVCVCGNYSHMR